MSIFRFRLLNHRRSYIIRLSFIFEEIIGKKTYQFFVELISKIQNKLKKKKTNHHLLFFTFQLSFYTICKS
ncbi:hypothetical protein EIM30_14475 [Listeria monocytogenes]|nr:hypothetical protein [Listeria monocytogenes]